MVGLTTVEGQETKLVVQDWSLYVQSCISMYLLSIYLIYVSRYAIASMQNLSRHSSLPEKNFGVEHASQQLNPYLSTPTP